MLTLKYGYMLNVWLK